MRTASPNFVDEHAWLEPREQERHRVRCTRPHSGPQIVDTRAERSRHIEIGRHGLL